MLPYRRFQSVPQLSTATIAFVAVALLLDSGGLLRWAQRLDVGPERSLALPLTTALHRALAPLGLERLRRSELSTLARLRWSDDPEALATTTPSPTIPAAGAPKPGAPDPGSPPSAVARWGGDLASETSVPTESPGSPPPTTPSPTPTPKPFTPLDTMKDAPPLTSTLPTISPLAPGHLRTVALAGDSMMAVGLSPVLLRSTARYPDLQFLKLFKSGTGLARPEVFNWQSEYPAMLAALPAQSPPPDIILVAIGANDGQGFVEDGVTYPFGTPGWQAIYQRRVQAYLAMLQASGATVLWLGLPPMKSPDYDARIALINRIDATVVNATPHAAWFSTAGLVGDPTGHYRDYGDIAGKTLRLRQGDGIHLSDDGATLLAAHLLPWLAAQQPSSTAKPAIKSAPSAH